MDLIYFRGIMKYSGLLYFKDEFSFYAYKVEISTNLFRIDESQTRKLCEC